MLHRRGGLVRCAGSAFRHERARQRGNAQLECVCATAAPVREWWCADECECWRCDDDDEWWWRELLPYVISTSTGPRVMSVPPLGMSYVALELVDEYEEVAS